MGQHDSLTRPKTGLHGRIIGQSRLAMDEKLVPNMLRSQLSLQTNGIVSGIMVSGQVTVVVFSERAICKLATDPYPSGERSRKAVGCFVIVPIASEQCWSPRREKNEKVKKMVGLAEELKNSLDKGKIDNFGEILHRGWLLKRELVRTISNPRLDEYYKKALKAGAIGGKLLGAGGGGFFLFYCKQKYQNRLRRTLALRELKFKFDNEGSKIIHIGEK